ncbi:U-box domain-containing protein 3-like [Telopea speciosissima]|uniref:U-box domain-containing protein 3-like n=1 Tax=Telopea speciosissima TaxID=54955 RepID=UPI001CC60171|nr:U-box domain-containing protein 3-like [Telopea speciosissima]XP_043690447.1 U-box domain-containing protein 3-like [Telopea speciosissima]XP_043690448.1 U-box domain-containing protein 3-like [Telopea speciosissima]
MDTRSVPCLVNSISRFIHLVACQTLKSVPIQKDYQYMVDLLKVLKPMLNEIVDSKLPTNGILFRECEELDLAVNQARDFMEKWDPKMSKIHSVLQSESLARKVRSSSLKICHMLCRLQQSSPLNSHLTSIQCCIQELQSLEQESISEVVEEAIKYQRDNKLIPRADILLKLVELFGFTSNQELLEESVALEKARVKAGCKKSTVELDHVDQIVNLVAHIRDWMGKLEQFGEINGVPVPPYFRCPLSLELMVDPVIVASGQTYERAFIQKWLDQGLSICPQTRQTLAHSNLIPNYTVKALIANWCEDNNIRIFRTADCNYMSSPSSSRNVSSFHGSLNGSNCTSRSFMDVGNGSEKQRVEVSSRGGVDNSNVCCSRINPKCDQPSPEQSYIHSRSESVSSGISSIEYLSTAMTTGLTEEPRVLSRHVSASVLSEVKSEGLACSPNRDSGFSPWLSGKQFHSSEIKVAVAEDGKNHHQRSLSLPFSDSGFDDLTSSSHVEKLVDDLKSQSNEVQTAAAAELRLLAKHNAENRIIIAQCGAIAPLISLLNSPVKLTQEHAVTALLNLSINDGNKALIAETGAIEPLIHVLKTGNAGAKENSSATLFSLSVLEEYKIKIGRSNAVKALVDLLGSGTLRGKKDAATALFNLSIFHENKARIVQAGAVKYLVELMDPSTGMVDKAVALLANLSTVPEGQSAITREGGIPLLVEVVESGSQRGKENAASILLQLCINSQKFCGLVLQEGAVPPLVALSQSGTLRAKEKAQQILCHFRNQREGAVGKARS